MTTQPNSQRGATMTDTMSRKRVERTCPTCGQSVPVVNHAIERRADGSTQEVGYLGRHWRPGIARTSKCRGSFGGWVR